MGSLGVVGLNISGNHFAQCPGIGVFVEVDLFGFQATKPALDHGIIRPAGLSVHTLGDAEFLQK